MGGRGSSSPLAAPTPAAAKKSDFAQKLDTWKTEARVQVATAAKAKRMSGSASDAQKRFLDSLRSEAIVPPDKYGNPGIISRPESDAYIASVVKDRERAVWAMEASTSGMSKAEASIAIETLKALPKRQKERAPRPSYPPRPPAAESREKASPRQVDYIMSLIAQGRRDEGGFYNGPRERSKVAAMSKAEASIYINSLTGRY